MQTDIFTICAFGPEHIDGALALSRAAGWPHRAEDWELIRGLSQGAVALDGDRVVATAMATPFGRVATVNMIIVDAAIRGRGLGRRIMQEAMAGLSPDEWRLVATRDGLPLYEKLGFVAYGEVLQHQGIVDIAGPGEDLAEPGADGLGWAVADDEVALAALDRAATGMNRSALITALLRVGRILELREGGRIVACAALRTFGRGAVAGPVLARDEAEAERLLTRLLSECNGAFLRVDTTADTDFAPWLERHGLAYAGGGTVMRRGPAVAAPSAVKPFALAAQAFG